MTLMRKVFGGVFVSIGLALFIFGVLLKWMIYPTVFEQQVYENLKLKDGTEIWDAFVSTFTFPLIQLFSFFSFLIT